jgi:hypothetical protein
MTLKIEVSSNLHGKSCSLILGDSSGRLRGSVLFVLRLASLAQGPSQKGPRIRSQDLHVI